jgi:chromosome segregation ATPase
MANEPDNLVLKLLRGIDSKVDDVQKELAMLKERAAATDNRVISLRKDVLSVDESIALLNVRLDQIDAKLNRVFVRLDLVDDEGASPPAGMQ